MKTRKPRSYRLKVCPRCNRQPGLGRGMCGAKFGAVLTISCLELALKRARADERESDAVRNRLHGLLKRTALALKGKPPPNTWHDLSDLPKLAARLTVEGEQVREQLIRLTATVKGQPKVGTLPTLEALDLRVREMRDAILWALGENGEFPEKSPARLGERPRPYYWRHELRKRSGL